jgi:hypothetical protein
MSNVDIVSGGAITHSVLYTLARMPSIRGQVRVIEPDVAEVSNLNRYALLLRRTLIRPRRTSCPETALGGIAVDRSRFAMIG